MELRSGRFVKIMIMKEKENAIKDFFVYIITNLLVNFDAKCKRYVFDKRNSCRFYF